MSMGCDPSWLQKLDSLRIDLTNGNHFRPIEISRLSLNASSWQSYHQIIEKILNKEVPFKINDSYLFHFKLPSARPHASVHFVWKQPVGQPVNCPEQVKLITDIRAQAKVYYTRAMKADVCQRILKLVVIKPRQVEHLIEDLLGDESLSTNEAAKKFKSGWILLSSLAPTL